VRQREEEERANASGAAPPEARTIGANGAAGRVNTERAPARSAQDAPKKLSYKEQRELAELPARIEALEQEQRALAARMASADFYKERADAIAASLARAESLERELAVVYARWAELDARS
jgi:ATP-binding cassette subfamily F protein uup